MPKVEQEWMWAMLDDGQAHALATIITSKELGTRARCGLAFRAYPTNLKARAGQFEEVCGKCVYQLNKEIIERGTQSGKPTQDDPLGQLTREWDEN